MCKILVLTLCVSCMSLAEAADFSADARGTTGAQFLELPAGARAIAMGSAYSSISGDPFSAYYNPAGLAGMRQYGVGLMHAVYFQDISYEYGIFAAPVEALGVIAVSAQYLSISKIAELDKTGTLTGDYLKPNDMALSAIYAKRIGVIDFGLSAKYIKSQILNSASTFGGDIGLQTKIGKCGFGLSVLNIGKEIKFHDEESNLPTTGRLGASVVVAPKWLFSVDVVAPKGAAPFAAAGAEYALIANSKMTVSVRGGYANRYASSKLGGAAGINAGAGLALGSANIDYAYSLYGDLGVTHRFSLNLKFGNDDNSEQNERPSPGHNLQALTTDPEPAPGQVGTPELLNNDAPKDAVLEPDVKKTYQEYVGAAENYTSQNDYANAAKEYEEAALVLPENDERRILILQEQGRISVKLGNIQKAKDYYLAAIQTAKILNIPDKDVINSYLGVAYCFEKSGDIAPAIDNYKTALELTPNYQTKVKIRENLDKLEAP